MTKIKLCRGEYSVILIWKDCSNKESLKRSLEKPAEEEMSLEANCNLNPYFVIGLENP